MSRQMAKEVLSTCERDSIDSKSHIELAKVRRCVSRAVGGIAFLTRANKKSLVLPFTVRSGCRVIGPRAPVSTSMG